MKGDTAMRPYSRIASLCCYAFGLALIAWVAYDATTVQRVLGLTPVLSEAAVAVAALALGSTSLGAGYVLWRAARRQARLDTVA